jgi:hypothetical protein
VNESTSIRKHRKLISMEFIYRLRKILSNSVLVLQLRVIAILLSATLLVLLLSQGAESMSLFKLPNTIERREMTCSIPCVPGISCSQVCGIVLGKIFRRLFLRNQMELKPR